MKKALFVLLIVAVVLPAFATGTQEEAEPLVWIWYPNESTPEFADARSAIIEVAENALGREIEEQLTTDYAIAIEALVNENATFSWFGGEGYTQAHARNVAVLPLVVNSGSSGTLDDAKYYSMLGTLVENADDYKVNGEFDLETLRQKKFSFVSNSSTSGFRVPSSVISAQFDVESEELLEGGSDMVFSEVMFGGSHQGSFFNVLDGRADIGAFCNSCIAEYVTFSGEFSDPLPGDTVTVIEGAAPPFDTMAGKEVVLVETVPVLNAPMVVQTDMLTDEELEAVREAFTSDEVAQNTRIFGDEGFFREGQRFLAVEDEWYDPIRRLSGLK
ncbi:MAG: PhnD/SsuA/transferrin family substrate-binding protein [Spirochaetota bacterium]